MQLLDALTVLYVLCLLVYERYGRNKLYCVSAASVVHTVDRDMPRNMFAAGLAVSTLLYGRAWTIATTLLYERGADAPLLTAWVVVGVGPTWVRAGSAMAALVSAPLGVATLAALVLGIAQWLPLMGLAAIHEWRWASTLGALFAGALSLALFTGADWALAATFAREPSPGERAFAAWAGLACATGAVVFRAWGVLTAVAYAGVTVDTRHAALARRFAGACVVEDPARTVAALEGLRVPKPLAQLVGQYQAPRDAYSLHLDDVAERVAEWRLAAPTVSARARLGAALTKKWPHDRELLLVHAATARAVLFQLPGRSCVVVAGTEQAPSRVAVDCWFPLWTQRAGALGVGGAFADRVRANEKWLLEAFPTLADRGMWHTLDNVCFFCPRPQAHHALHNATRLAPAHGLLRTFAIYYCHRRFRFVAVEPFGEAAVVGGAPRPVSHERQPDNTVLDFSECVSVATDTDAVTSDPA